MSGVPISPGALNALGVEMSPGVFAALGVPISPGATAVPMSPASAAEEISRVKAVVQSTERNHFIVFSPSELKFAGLVVWVGLHLGKSSHPATVITVSVSL
jgi:hypothetical protein